MSDFAGIAWAPLLPWETLAALAVASMALVLYGLLGGARGTLLRIVPLGVLLVVLANPQVVREARTPLNDVAVVVVDDSASQSLGERREQTDAAVSALRERLGEEEGLEVRVVEARRGSGAASEDGTRLFSALNRAIADVPRQRLAGAVMVTDGQVHDVPEQAGGLPAAPLHVLLTGEEGETDRRLVVETAPTYGLVDKDVVMRVRVEDPTMTPGARVPLTVRLEDGQPIPMSAPVGETIDLPLPVRHGGHNVVEVAAEPRDGELTEINNRTALTINGVRDRLRVLLISGEPHVGERAWRNLLKADPNVDLVHFTILRPPTKDDGTPLSELALIAFPIRELFEERLQEFDLIVFDRYSRQGLVPYGFLQNIADYVNEGGAVLQAVGPEFAGPFTLYDSPLGGVLPAAPTGEVVDGPFLPRVSGQGQRHPVTAGLEEDSMRSSADRNAPGWGRWLRYIPAAVERGETLMTGPDGLPLLALDRVGEGRVAMLLSDTVWLWARGYEGGGPQAELVRRLAHWLMKEPELEEEALRARVEGDRLQIERRTLGDVPPEGTEVSVTMPSGEVREARLESAGPGRETLSLEVGEPGVWRVEGAGQVAVAAAGPPNPLEMGEVAATDARLRPAAEATGGGVFWLSGLGGSIPEVRRTSAEDLQSGSRWIGLRANNDYVVNGITQAALIPTMLGLLLVVGGMVLAWWREGR